jgi:hypothetical protein
MILRKGPTAKLLGAQAATVIPVARIATACRSIFFVIDASQTHGVAFENLRRMQKAGKSQRMILSRR